MRCLVLLAALVLARPLSAQYATLVPADTGGRFYNRGPDTLYTGNKSFAAADSAPKKYDCVHSGRALRMLARDSMQVAIGNSQRFWVGSLRTGEMRRVDSTWALPSGARFTLLDISAPISECGVNAGQVWFHWRLERAPEEKAP